MRYRTRFITKKQLANIFLSGKVVIVRRRSKIDNSILNTEEVTLQLWNYGGGRTDRRAVENLTLTKDLGFPRASNTRVWVVSKPHGGGSSFQELYQDFLNGKVDFIYRKRKLSLTSKESDVST